MGAVGGDLELVRPVTGSQLVGHKLAPTTELRSTEQIILPGWVDVLNDRPIETYEVTSTGLQRSVLRTSGDLAISVLPAEIPGHPLGLATTELAEQVLLRSPLRPQPREIGRAVSVVDLFAGCGGLSLGVREACTALGLEFKGALALDNDAVAMEAYRHNFPAAHGLTAEIDTIVDGQVGQAITPAERKMREMAGDVTLLIGGPPCEGHSDFNNRTRHADSRNSLYLRMVRATEILEPEHVVIENVPGALRDKTKVVQRSVEALSRLGYTTTSDVIDLSAIGVPQQRKRLVVIASRTRGIDAARLKSAHGTTQRTVRWAISDLVDMTADRPYDTPAVSAPATRRRIDYLFDHDLSELPDQERPDCHANKNHTYRSIYGRMNWDRPAQTITTGFYSMCMGRYVHPSLRRTITAHEAARLQFFPDFFDFSGVARRGDLARLIGNAVPMKLGYVLALALLR